MLQGRMCKKTDGVAIATATTTTTIKLGEETNYRSQPLSSVLTVIIHNGIYPKFLMRFFSLKASTTTSDRRRQAPTSAWRRMLYDKYKPKLACLIWIAEQAPAELQMNWQLWKLYTLFFCMRQQYEKKKKRKIFIKIFHPLLLWFFSCLADPTMKLQPHENKKLHPFSLVKKFSYFASLKNGRTGRNQGERWTIPIGLNPTATLALRFYIIILI